MRSATVQGLTPDGRSLLVRLGEGDDAEVVVLSLAEVRQAQRAAPPLPLGGGPSPREVQGRIRAGESADDIARSYGLPVDAVARFEGPVLAERAHHARMARLSDADGRSVEDRVLEHAERLQAGGVSWDSRQTDPRRWEVRATAGGMVVRLAWDPGTRRADGLDEPSRQAIGQAPLPEEALDAVLRPVRVRKGPREERPAQATPPPRKRAQVPLWDDISAGVAGRDRP